MKQNDLDIHKNEIVKLISENKSHTYIYKYLKCARSTLLSWLKQNKIDYSGNQGHKGEHLRSTEEIFAKDTHYASGSFIDWILDRKILEYKCNKCGIDKWNNKKIRLEVDHMNGIRSDNRQENLQFLCPNCHSQTPTFRGRNVNKGLKVSNEDLLKAIHESTNIYNALIKVGLAPKGANYKRAQKLLNL